MPLRPYSRSFDDARASSASAGGLERRVTLGLALGLAGLVIALILRLLLPWLLGAAAVGAAVWGWRRYRARQLALHQVFYAQLAAYRGRVSVLDFAIAAQITGGEARRFLDQRAQEFWGDFEPTAAGDVLYTFRSLGTDPPLHADLVNTDSLNTEPLYTDLNTGLSADGNPEISVASPAPQAADPPPGLSLPTADLAQRLGCTEGDLVRRRTAPDFAAWCRQRDPDGCGWRYEGGCDRYWPEPRQPRSLSGAEF